MKLRFYLILMCFVQLFSNCGNNSPKRNLIESKPAFFKLHNGNWLKNEWIREPRNLLIIHETCKKFGYSNLLPAGFLSEAPFIINNLYFKTKGLIILDSLILTYQQYDLKEKYYREFWERRKVEKNDSIVHRILLDIKFSFKSKLSSAALSLSSNAKLVNDTLLNLLKIEYPNSILKDEIALDNFKLLRQMGFHESAYNLLYERSDYYGIHWDRDSLELTLKETDIETDAWFQDDTP